MLRNTRERPRTTLGWLALCALLAGVAVAGGYAFPAFGPRAVTLLACFTPLSAVALIRRASRASPEPIIAWLIAIAHATFFTAGALGIWLRGNYTPFLGLQPVSDGGLMVFTLRISAIATCLACGVALGERNSRPATPSSPTQIIAQQRVLFIASQLLFTASLAGFLLTVDSLGGLGATASTFRTHEFDAITTSVGTLGLSAWAVFSVPAGILVSTEIWSRRNHMRASIALAELASLIAVMLFVFGSRLNVALVVIGCLLYRFEVTGRGIPIRQTLLGLTVFALVSGPVLEQRAALKGADASTGLTDALAYGIVDVGTAASLVRDSIATGERDWERYGTLLASMVPGLGPPASDIQAARLDRILGQTIATPAQRGNSALPPSLPVTLDLSWGLMLGSGIAALIGYALGTIAQWLRRVRSPYRLFASSLYGVYVVNAYKDGDLPLNAATTVRQAIIVSVAIAVVALPFGRVHWLRGRG